MELALPVVVLIAFAAYAVALIRANRAVRVRHHTQQESVHSEPAPSRGIVVTILHLIGFVWIVLLVLVIVGILIVVVFQLRFE